MHPSPAGMSTRNSSPCAAGMDRINSSPAAAAGMNDDAGQLEPWRRFFSGVDVFSVLTHAILVAATDSPQEFRRRRDRIVRQIYSASEAVVPTDLGRWRPAGERRPHRVPAGNGAGHDDNVAATRSSLFKSGPPPPPPEGGNEEKGTMAGAACRRLVTASNQHVARGHGGFNNNAGGSSAELGSEWLDMLAEEMDEAKMVTEEVLRIKAILVNYYEHSADVLFESLRRLQLMQLTVDKLKSTEIGMVVAALEKHKSHKIRKLAQDIAKSWKVVTDEWVDATKAPTASDDSNKFLEKPNTSTAAEDEGGLAIPPMDEGALFMSQATSFQHVSEFLDGIDDDGGILNDHRTSMDKAGGSGSKTKCKGTRHHSDTVAEGTTQRRRPVIVVRCVSGTHGSLLKKTNPQKGRCDVANERVVDHQHRDLEERPGQSPLQRNPTNKMLIEGDEETTVHKTQVVLPRRQAEVVFPATNMQKPQEYGRSYTRVATTYDKPRSTEGGAWSPSNKGTPNKKTPHEDVKPRQNRGGVTFTGSPPVAAARKPLSGHVTETGSPVQSTESPEVGLGKRKIHPPADVRLERTKHRLREAYQEAENAKRKRTVQFMEPHDIPKPMGRKRPASFK